MFKFQYQRGFSIIELMITMVISFILVTLVMQLYLSSSASHRLYQGSLRLQQDGQYAMQIMAQNLRQAGFGHVTSANINAAVVDRTDFVDATGKPGRGLRGCDGGFNRPTSSPPDFGCKNGIGPAAFAVSYRSSDTFNSANGSGADCNGAEINSHTLPSSHPAYIFNKNVRIVVNHFFVATPARSKFASLYCNGNGGLIAQPVLDNVEDMRLTYGVAAAGGSSVQQFMNAVGVDALSADVTENWRRVISVKLCLQIVGGTHQTSEPQRYIDCNGVEQIAKDHKLRAVLTSVTMLRNSG